MVKQENQEDGTVDKENENEHSLHIDSKLSERFTILDLAEVADVFKSFVSAAANVANKEGR